MGTVVKPLIDPLVSQLVSTQPVDPVAAAIQYLHDVQRHQDSDVLADDDDVAPPAAAAKETASNRSTLPTDEEWFRSIFASALTRGRKVENVPESKLLRAKLSGQQKRS